MRVFKFRKCKFVLRKDSDAGWVLALFWWRIFLQMLAIKEAQR